MPLTDDNNGDRDMPPRACHGLPTSAWPTGTALTDPVGMDTRALVRTVIVALVLLAVLGGVAAALFDTLAASTP